MQVMESHAECSASVTRIRTPQLEYHSNQTTVHDIFLSHSGKQKGFAKDLYKVLSPLYNTFFDIKRHSIPAGQHFPSKIFKAAKTCQVAVVVLSEDFMCSKWTMLELSTFVDRLPEIHILPLFYQILPGDLKLEKNLERWNEVWKGYVEQDGKYTINVAEWARAVRTLCSINGLIYDSSEGVLEYLDKIKSIIPTMMSPTITYDEHHLYGKDRLCKVILDRFEDMEQRTEQSKAFVVGLFGPPGSGKSTLSLLIRDHFYRHSRRVLYLKLPKQTDSINNHDELLKVFKKLLGLTDFQNEIDLDKISELRDVITLLKRFNLPSLRVCLVVDNIQGQSIKAVQKILELGVGPGSKVILVSQTPDVLQPVLRMQGNHYMFDCVCMPRLLETEALEFFLHLVGAGFGLDALAIEESATARKREIGLAIVRTCGLGSEDSLSYLPAAVEKIAEEILRHREDAEDSEQGLERLLEGQVMLRLRDCNLQGVRDFILDSFNALPDEQLQILFLDIALFIVPANIQNKRKACETLRVMHECSPEVLQTMIEELERRDFVKASHSGFSVHEVHAHFAKSVAEGWGNIKHAAVKPTVTLTEMYDDIQPRTLIMEVEGEGSNKLDLWQLHGLKAVFVRNCKSVQAVEFTGTSHLSWSSSRLSLSIDKCPSLWYVGAPRNASFRTGQGETMRREIITLLLSIFSTKLSFFLYHKTRQQIPSPALPLFLPLFLSLPLALFSPSLPLSLFLTFYFLSYSLSLSSVCSLIAFIKRELSLALFLILTHTRMEYYLYGASHSFASLAFSLSFVIFLSLSLAVFPLSLSSFFLYLHLYSVCHSVWLGFELAIFLMKLMVLSPLTPPPRAITVDSSKLFQNIFYKLGL